MEIETEVTLTNTVKIHINTEEAIDAILQHPESGYKLLRFLNDACIAFREIPDDMITAMKPKQRKIVAVALTEQSARYAITTSTTRERLKKAWKSSFGQAMRNDEEAKRLDDLLKQAAKDISLLLELIDFDARFAINICTKHGGAGFMSDCMSCKKIREIRKRYKA